jgi:hypothetical protein
MSLVFVEAPMALFKSSAELIDGISGASQPATLDMTLDELIERRAALTKAKEAGLSCGAAWAAGYSCADAKAVGYDLIDAKAAGWTTEELLNAGYINQALAMRLRATDEPGRTLRLNVGSEGGALVNSLEESPTKHR